MTKLVRIYLTPKGRPFAVIDRDTLVGKKAVIEQIHKELKEKDYPAECITMEVRS